MNANLVMMASFIANELRASSPYKTGNMQRSIASVVIDEDTIDIVIAVDYASYVNDKGKHKDWVKTVVDRCVRALYGMSVDDTSLRTGLSYNIISGIGKGG